MNQRSSLIVFCFASALVGGIVATQSAGRDRATAQVANVAAGVETVALPSRCNQCAWDGKRIEYIATTERLRIQVFPVGTSGVVHSIIRSPSPYTCILDVMGEGDAADPNAITYGRPDEFWNTYVNQENDIRFTSGLWIETRNVNECGQPSNATNAFVVLYRLDTPLSTAPEK
ncbi:MAG: hypothetical protein HZA51_17905 [Planctomycetes bacterium]|nr:hypothetical protein [Planctomycetota bacterium]